MEGLGVPVEIATTEAHVPSFMVREHFPPLKSLGNKIQPVDCKIILLLFSGEMGVLPADKEGGRGEGRKWRGGEGERSGEWS